MAKHALLAVACGLVVAMFQWFGNASSTAMEGQSLFWWIGSQWLQQGGDFSHGWLMPLVSLWVIRTKRREIVAAPKRVDWRGLAVVVLSLALHWVSYRAQQPRISLVALVGVCWGIPFYLWGESVARALLFPAGYLLLCFTSSLLFFATFRLRLLSTILASGILNGIGIESVRRGTAIFSSAGGGFQLEVADPCSGLRSLFSMTALAAPYAYFVMSSLGLKWALFLLSVPMAVIGNTLRIVTIALVAHFYDMEAAMRLYHDYSGYIVFAILIGLLIGTGALLERGQRGLRALRKAGGA